MIPSSRSVHKVWNSSKINWRICKQTSDVCMCAPQMMADHFAAAEIVDFKPQMTISLICLEQRCVCVSTKILLHTHTHTHILLNPLSLWVNFSPPSIKILTFFHYISLPDQLPSKLTFPYRPTLFLHCLSGTQQQPPKKGKGSRGSFKLLC